MFALNWWVHGKGFKLPWSISRQMDKTIEKMLKEMLIGNGTKSEMRGLDAIVDDK